MEAIASAIPITENDVVRRELRIEETPVVSLKQLLALSLSHRPPSF